jgi:hypothetical protein
MAWWDDIGGDTLSSLADKLGFGPGDTKSTTNAEEYLDQGLKSFDGITAPNLGQVNLQGTTYAGDITPGSVNFQGADAAKVGPSEMGGIVTDPRLRDAQMKALQSMQGIADSGGMTDTETANLRRSQNAADTDDSARRNAILQNMHQRGLGGSGQELLAQLASSEAATDRGAQAGLDVNAMAQARALQAMQGAGQMGGALRSQDYGEKANAASAQDAINKFNAQNQQSTNQFNAGTMNQSQLANAQMGMSAQGQNQGARQGVNNYNTGVANQQTTTNQLTIPQQTYQNQMGIAQGKAGVLANATNYYNNKDAIAAQTQAAKQGSLLGLGGQLGAAAIMAAHGGRIPGIPHVGGDSYLNDTVHVLASPGEVQVPRTLAAHGTTEQIGQFVKHAPSALAPDKHKEAMLSALKNIRKRNGG